jgi:hypothetical protein
MPPADPSTANRLPTSAYQLTIRQQPERAKVTGQGKEKDRKPIDPPPIIQLKIRDPNDPAQNYLQSPYYFVCMNLWHATEDRQVEPGNDPPLSGSIVSSLHRLKDIDNVDGGFFVFGDVSVKVEGTFRIKFVLHESMQGAAIPLAQVITEPFTVYSAKNFPGMAESTFLSRSFGDQGVRLRIRKETRKRPASRDNSHADGGYGQSRQDPGPIHQPTYSQPTYSQVQRDYRGYEEPLTKRQRSVGAGSNIYDSSRPEWGYQQPSQQAYPSHSTYSHIGSTTQATASAYPTHTSAQAYDHVSQTQTANPYPTPTSSQIHGHVGTAPLALDNFTFRPHPSDPSLIQSTYNPAQSSTYHDTASRNQDHFYPAMSGRAHGRGYS